MARIGRKVNYSCMTCKSTTVTPLLKEFGDDYWYAILEVNLYHAWRS
ncbi:hypothetical protein KHA80_05735 [Anaerobacillus sp. HL2]|nr:hypothetical protein KHA80_05735 [Anaerobacillus sp. HL2]